MKYVLENLFLKIILISVRIANHKLLVKMSAVLAFVFYNLLPLRKTVVLENLKSAFPDLDEKDISLIAKKSYKSFAITFLELLKLKYSTKQEIIDQVIFDSNETVKDCIKNNKSLILLTAHFGSWEYGAMSYGIKYNIPMNVLAKRQSNQHVTDLVTEIRTRFGNKEIFTGSSVKEIYKALLEKEIIGVVGDQRGPKEGPRVKFFGKDTAVFTGTATMALKTKTPIVVILVARQKDYKYKMISEEISFENLPEKLEDQVVEINQRYFNILERTIKEYPEQWFWMHKIWKY